MGFPALGYRTFDMGSQWLLVIFSLVLIGHGGFFGLVLRHAIDTVHLLMKTTLPNHFSFFFFLMITKEMNKKGLNKQRSNTYPLPP